MMRLWSVRSLSVGVITALALVCPAPSHAACNVIETVWTACNQPPFPGGTYQMLLSGKVGVTNPLHTVPEVELYMNGVWRQDVYNPQQLGAGQLLCGGQNVNYAQRYAYNFFEGTLADNTRNVFYTLAYINLGGGQVGNARSQDWTVGPFDCPG